MNNLRKIIASLYIIAGQIDDLKKKYPNLPLNQIEHLKPKYYLWAVKQLIDNADVKQVVSLLEQFEKTQSRLEEKDINKYKNLEQLNSILNSLGESKTKIKTQTKTSGSKKLLENDKYLLLRIESKGACIQYGNKNTLNTTH
jgi:predicted nucleic acid-binding protein